MRSHLTNILIASIGLGLAANIADAGFPYSDRYEAWIQNHEFPIGSFYTGENPSPALTQAQRIDRYQDAGYTRLMAYWTPTGASDAAYAESIDMDWSMIASTPSTYQTYVAAAMAVGDGPSAIIVADEPIDSQIQDVADRIHWVQQNYQVNYSVTPLVYANLSALSIDIDDYITECDPDVLSYDRYPHFLDGSDEDYYFAEMNLVRSKSLQYNVPMWMVQQGFSRTWTGDGQQYRLPSESDIRFQAFSFLAHGGQGIDHFMYLSESFPEAVINHSNNQPSSAYYAIQDMTPEILNLGQTLPLLEPVGDVEFLGDAASYFDDVELFQATSSRDLYNIEGAESALVSFFEDEYGGDYFMIVNLVHGADLDKDEAEDTMLLFFDPDVTSIQRLNRFTGDVETLNTTNNPSGGNRYLYITLEGGTGDLFKYPASSSFVMIPEPVSASALLLVAMAQPVRRNRKLCSFARQFR